MKNKIIILPLLLLFIVFIFSFSVVSAAEYSINDVGDDNNANLILNTYGEENLVGANDDGTNFNERVLDSTNDDKDFLYEENVDVISDERINGESILEENVDVISDEGINEKPILKEGGTKSFSDLNNLINGNSDSIIYLEDDYKYDSNTDSNYANGILINRNLEIYGGGHTINGSYLASTFYQDGKNFNIYLYSINFVDCHGYARSTVDYLTAAINCTFIGCKSGFGGALHFCDAINCTFINNSASDFGGAMV